jgi:hypothetical protein
MVRQRRGQHLDARITAAHASEHGPLRSFAVGLGKDFDAVRAGLSMPWNSGAVEGNVNRLKTIKRQMYGRANFDLLRRRVLLAHWHHEIRARTSFTCRRHDADASVEVGHTGVESHWRAPGRNGRAAAFPLAGRDALQLTGSENDRWP